MKLKEFKKDRITRTNEVDIKNFKKFPNESENVEKTELNYPLLWQ